MFMIEKYYHKIKYLLLEYKNTLDLDSKYMNEYLNKCGKDLNIEEPIIKDNIDSEFNENIKINIEQNTKQTTKQTTQDSTEQTKIELESSCDTDTNICPKILAKIAKIFYRPLAKLLHPDKNNNKSDEFIELNTAYSTSDYLTLFLFYYEKKMELNTKITISVDIVNLLEKEIKKKENEINNIKNKIHWQWIHSNELEKQFIQEYIKQQM